jgi:hypothetical protein
VDCVAGGADLEDGAFCCVEGEIPVLVGGYRAVGAFDGDRCEGNRFAFVVGDLTGDGVFLSLGGEAEQSYKGDCEQLS